MALIHDLFLTLCNLCTCLIYDRVLFINKSVGFSLVPYSLGAWESGSASLKIIGRAHFEKNQLFYRIPYTHFG